MSFHRLHYSRGALATSIKHLHKHSVCEFAKLIHISIYYYCTGGIALFQAFLQTCHPYIPFLYLLTPIILFMLLAVLCSHCPLTLWG